MSLIDVFDATQTEFPEAGGCGPSLAVRPGTDQKVIGVFLRNEKGEPMAAFELQPEAAMRVAQWLIETSFTLHGYQQREAEMQRTIDDVIPSIVQNVATTVQLAILDKFHVSTKDDDGQG